MADEYRGRGGISPLAAALFGAVVGALAMALSNRENRARLIKKLNELSETADERIGEMKRKVGELKKSGKAKIAEELEKARDRLTEESA